MGDGHKNVVIPERYVYSRSLGIKSLIALVQSRKAWSICHGMCKSRRRVSGSVATAACAELTKLPDPRGDHEHDRRHVADAGEPGRLLRWRPRSIAGMTRVKAMPLVLPVCLAAIRLLRAEPVAAGNRVPTRSPIPINRGLKPFPRGHRAGLC